jgi:hypothetical protein
MKTETANLLRRRVSRIVFEVFSTPLTRPSGLRCIFSIFMNFFFLQYYAVLCPRSPVSRAEDPLDDKIPFTPGRIRTYLTFVTFWIHLIGFLIGRYGRGGYVLANDFIKSMEKLYLFAAQIYKKNLSTTQRPKYKRNFFRLVHATDPHLMCIPSLHVMIVIHTYTMLREYLLSQGDFETYFKETENVRRGALAITEAVLYVKQHSVNCISASMYAMSCFSPSRFPPQEAVKFAGDLFTGKAFDPANPENPEKPLERIFPEDKEALTAYIIGLYYSFLEEGKKSTDWKKPLLDFLKKLPASL